MNKLKECPNCKQYPSVMHQTYGITVTCDNCYDGTKSSLIGISSYRKNWENTEKLAIESWNEQVEEYEYL